ncbi:YpoC family protein [Neobacillus muris]|uniref:YpoC family protein n=1 Tax=Neobacillus muris TaxID=2941334 RepID=UPI0020419031|nr:hypothetical protein [Neobacillus muris]
MNNQQDTAKKILTEWGEMKQELEGFFRDRDQAKAETKMKQGISLLIHLLYITNGRDDYHHSQPALYPQFMIKPINLEERLEFIRKRPALFHSYRQLSELMIELEKLFVKQTIKKSSRTTS